MNNDKIKARIKALLAKNIDNGATKAEMESALEKANQLMLEYFISENDLDDPYIDEQCGLIEVPLIESAYDLTLFYNKLAQLFDCEYFFNSKRIAFFGFKEDTEMCAYFFKLITRACLTAKDDFVQSPYYRSMKKQVHGRTLIASFLKGFQLEVASKMHRMYEHRTRNIAAEKFAVMVVDKNKKVKLQFGVLDLKIREAKSNFKNIEREAYLIGEIEGENFELTQGLKGQEVEMSKALAS